ncbi:MAG: GAF domain-containing protein [Chloroflexi bacterium]|nr:GAF domain-containing protein [Chloroflexota bacterium]
MDADKQTLRSLREENIRLKDKTQDLQTEVDRLRQIIHALNTLQYNIDAITPDTDVLALIYNILSAAIEAIGSNDGSLLLLDTDEEQLVFVEVIGIGSEQLIGFRIPSNEGIAGWVLTNKSPTIVPNVRQDARWSPSVDEAISFRTAALICVPLLDDERPLGVIEVLNPLSGGPFCIEDLDILSLIARLASLALVRAEEVGAADKEKDPTP